MKARIRRSNRKGKQKRATFMYMGKKITIHFGDTQASFPGKKKADNLCSRTYGIKDARGKPTRNNPLTANYWSRRVLWHCDGKKSRRK